MDIKKTLKKYNLSVSARLSQNFLRSENMADRIVEWAGVGEKDTVLEIGTGLGILTTALRKKAEKVITFEADKKLLPHLPFILQSDYTVEVIPGDFLKYDLSILKKRFKRVKVVANLPFHISTEVMFKLFKERKWIESMTLMFQKEVAQRIVSGPGNKVYGILSVLSQLYSEPEICFSVAPNCFFPAPKVAAAIVHFPMKKKMIIKDRHEEIFKKIVKSAFGQRRKTLLNSLRKVCPPLALKKACEKTGIDLSRRAETLSLVEFKLLMEAIIRAKGIR